MPCECQLHYTESLQKVKLTNIYLKLFIAINKRQTACQKSFIHTLSYRFSYPLLTLHVFI